MYGDRPNEPGDITIQADHCLSFEVPKLSFFFPSNSSRLGSWGAKSIGLMPEFLNQIETHFFVTEPSRLAKGLNKRNKFSHKGHFGHALIAAGSKGMTGAAVLSSKACLRSGAGMVTALIPDCGYTVLQTAVPEVMTIQGHGSDHLRTCPDLGKFTAIAIGPGLGVNEDTRVFLREFLKNYNGKLIIDADALNILAEKPEIMELLPKSAILTPHPGEFSRLFGASTNDLETLELLSAKAKAHQCIIVLKGANTAIADMDGHIYFNTSGNPGMSTAGVGDVLTGMICGLLCQGYDALFAAKAGVYLHGLAGDVAMEQRGLEAMISGDLVEMIGSAYKKLHQYDAE
jgi:NAD(P)H-hydrate epimerase